MQKIEELYYKLRVLSQEISIECNKHDMCKGCPMNVKDEDGNVTPICKMAEIIGSPKALPCFWNVPDEPYEKED